MGEIQTQLKWQIQNEYIYKYKNKFKHKKGFSLSPRSPLGSLTQQISPAISTVCSTRGWKIILRKSEYCIKLSEEWVFQIWDMVPILSWVQKLVIKILGFEVIYQLYICWDCSITPPFQGGQLKHLTWIEFEFAVTTVPGPPPPSKVVN